MPIELFEHNRTAYESASAMLQSVGKAAVIHPTGTGKSFIAFKLCEDHPDTPVCWLSPSEHIFRTQQENLRATGCRVPDNTRFCTYARLAQMTDGEVAALNPGYIILDEFHRAGADVWSIGVLRLLELFPKAPVLGLSATNVRYLDNQRDMAVELFDGNIASEMTLGEAIARGILTAPKYVLSVYSIQESISKLEDRVRKAKSEYVRQTARKFLESLKRSLAKAEGLESIFEKHMAERHGKYLVFCPDVEHMNDIMKKARKWFARLDDRPRLYSVQSGDPEASRQFARFKKDGSDHLRLLFSIDMLNEGIHVNDVNGVIFFRPTSSPIIYKQQIGRALSAAKGKNPVVFDLVNNFEGLYSIGAIEQEFRDAIVGSAHRGEKTFPTVNEPFKVIDTVRNCREIFESLNDALSASWEMMYENAARYHAEHGDLAVPRQYRTDDGCSLGLWIDIQRRVRAGKTAGRMTPDRISRLDAIGMIWDNRYDQVWNKYYEACVGYNQETGGLDVPVGYVTKDGLKLGAWLSSLRTQNAEGRSAARLSAERRRKLEALGMVWSKYSMRWEKHFQDAEEYYRTHGDLRVPADCMGSSGDSLYAWLQMQKKARKGRKGVSALTGEQISRLDAIGMVWQSRNELEWERGIRNARLYLQEHGDLNVPERHVCADGHRLGQWLRMKKKNWEKLNDAQKNELSALGL